MTNRQIEEGLRRAVARETPDLLQQVLLHCGEDRRLLDMEEKSVRKLPRPMVWAAGAAAALLVAAGGFGLQAAYGVDSVIAIDVNPSVELKTNRSEKVLSVAALNGDADSLLDGMNLKGVPLDVAVNALIGSMVKNGYIDQAHNSVLVTVENRNAARRQQLQDETAASIHRALDGYSLTAAVLQQPLQQDAGREALAEEHHISQGRAALIQKLLALDPTLTAEQLVPLNINDLSLLLLSKEPEAVKVAYGQVSDSAYIGAEAAAQLALARAPAGSTVKEIEFDWEDGRPVYEGELRSGTTEYEFEMDAATGEFLQWKEDIDHHPTAPAAGNGAGSGTGGLIGEEQARSLAQNRAPAGATMVEFALDYDDGRPVYEGELRSGATEYEFEIDAATGEFLKWKEDIDD